MVAPLCDLVGSIYQSLMTVREVRETREGLAPDREIRGAPYAMQSCARFVRKMTGSAESDQVWLRGRAGRPRNSQCKIVHVCSLQAQPGPSRDDIPCARGRPETADDL